jgi:predicted TPR repeat methyltransferase
VFDAFASSFDAKLESLHYRAPKLVADALRDVLPPPAAQFDIADLGCGTGLVGPMLRPWARHLAGCDLSVGMLRQAKRRGGYDVLHKAELVYYLQTQPARFDVLVSADTLCYFGDLGEAMVAAAHALRAGGRMVFTVEALDANASGTAVQLQPCGRYAHGQDHVAHAVSTAGLSIKSVVLATLRYEAGQPVFGWLTVLQN